MGADRDGGSGKWRQLFGVGGSLLEKVWWVWAGGRSTGKLSCSTLPTDPQAHRPNIRRNKPHRRTPRPYPPQGMGIDQGTRQVRGTLWPNFTQQLRSNAQWRQRHHLGPSSCLLAISLAPSWRRQNTDWKLPPKRSSLMPLLGFKEDTQAGKNPWSWDIINVFDCVRTLENIFWRRGNSVVRSFRNPSTETACWVICFLLVQAAVVLD